MPALLRQTSTVSATAVFTQGRPERRAPPPPPSQGDRLRTAQVHERRCTSAGACHPTLPYPGCDLDAAGHGVHLGVPLREQLGAADDGGRDARACGAGHARHAPASAAAATPPTSRPGRRRALRRHSKHSRRKHADASTVVRGACAAGPGGIVGRRRARRARAGCCTSRARCA